MGIEKIKSDVYKAIDIERQRAMEKYDTHKENIKNSKSVPGILNLETMVGILIIKIFMV